MRPALHLLAVALGGLLAVFGAFLVPARPLPGISAGVVIALLGNGPLAYASARVLERPVAGIEPGLAWLLVVLYFGTTRPEGDLVVTGSAAGLTFILGGVVSAAVGVGAALRRTALSNL